MPNEDYGLEVAKAAAEAAAKESVNKIASAISGAFPFWGLRKEAINTYITEIQSSDLSPDAKMIAIATAKKKYRHLKNQADIAQIAQVNAAPGTDFSENSSVSDEWLERIMDSAKFVSDEEVQLLWGKIIAREFEEPNSTPPSAIRILTEITPKYAKLFQIICSLSVCLEIEDPSGNSLGTINRIILPNDYDYLNDYGVSFTNLAELEMLGLIQFNSTTGFILTLDPEIYTKIHIHYNGDSATITKYPSNKFPLGVVLLTDAGKTFSNLTEQLVIENHFDNVCKFLKSKSVEFS